MSIVPEGQAGHRWVSGDGTTPARRHSVRKLLLLCALALTLGCDAELRPGYYSCITDADCPAGWSCWSTNLCYDRLEPQADAGTNNDAGPVDGGADPNDAEPKDQGTADASDGGAPDVDDPGDAASPDGGPEDRGTFAPRLVDLTFTGGQLEQTFDPERSSYTVRYPEQSTSLTLSAVAAQPWMDIRVDHNSIGFGAANTPIDVSSRHLPLRVSVHESTEVFRYVVGLLPVWSSATYFKASNPGAGDGFGYSVALDGDTLVVGAYREGSDATTVNGDEANDRAPASGAAYVYHRDPAGVWRQQAYLKANNAGPDDYFGYAVAISGDTIVIGAPYESGSGTGVNPPPNDQGLYNGAVYVFVRSGDVWSQQAYLKGSNTQGGDQFGGAVAIYGDTLVASSVIERSGATGVNGDQADTSAPFSGAAYVFRRSPSGWAQEAYLKAADTQANDQFGFDVAIWGDLIAVGAYLEDGPNDALPDSGSVYVFHRVFGAWFPQIQMQGFQPSAGDHFGMSVALREWVLAVGAPGEDGGGLGVNSPVDEADPDSGAVYVFHGDPDGWGGFAYVKATAHVFDPFGRGVALGDGLLAVASTIGLRPVELYRSQGNVWFQRLTLEQFPNWSVGGGAWDVAASGQQVLIATPGDDSNTSGVGGVPGGGGADDSGAVYLVAP